MSSKREAAGVPEQSGLTKSFRSEPDEVVAGPSFPALVQRKPIVGPRGEAFGEYA